MTLDRLESLTLRFAEREIALNADVDSVVNERNNNTYKYNIRDAWFLILNISYFIHSNVLNKNT